MKIIYLDSYTVNPGDLSWDCIEACGELTVYHRTDPDDVVPRSLEADVLIVNKTCLTADHFARLPKLRLVCEAATGYDNIDVQAARAHGVTVCNCAGYSSGAVAQMVLSFILEVADSVGEYAWRNRMGDWTRSNDFSYTVRPRLELSGKKVAIVGFGNIGQAVARVLRPLGVRLFAVSGKPQEQLPADVMKMEMEEAFATCDIVSLNCPLTPSNRGFVDARLLRHCNPRLILVNTARGALVNEEDVAEALRGGRLRAYCTDVLTHEPPLPGCPILSAPNAYVTPHIAWASSEARQRLLRIVADNIGAFKNGQPQNVVN